MTREELASLLRRLAPTLDALAEPWTLFGSAALLVRGLPEPEVADLDIFTTEAGAAQLEAAWAALRQAGYAPNSDDPFRSRFSRYLAPEGPVEVMGGLRHRLGEVWTPVTISEIEQVSFAGRAWPLPSAPEQLRVLRQFGRPKDLVRAGRLEAWTAPG